MKSRATPRAKPRIGATNPFAIAFAPATVANVAVGFDILGFALKGLGERATVEKCPRSRDVIMEAVEGYPSLSLDPLKNTATAGLVQLVRDKKLDFGFRVRLQKNIPIGSGLGGSSTSAVASIVAASALLKKPLTRHELLHYALIGEEVASGARHGDNVAPCLEGGLLFVRSRDGRTVKIKTPRALRCVVLLPDVRVDTREARSILKKEVSLRDVIAQTSNLTGFLMGCVRNDFTLIRESMHDAIIEAQRANAIPRFYDFQMAARELGALGCSISGSGPAIFAWAEDDLIAGRIQRRWLRIAESGKIKLVNSWISPIHPKGAHVVKVGR